MTQYDYDLFVIGAGSGGVRASRMAAQYGARVAIAEDRYLGGTCVNVGCVPKKLYVYASQFSEAFADAKGFGWQTQPAEFNWGHLRDNKTAEISRLNGVYRNLLKNAGVSLIDGRASILDPHTITVNGQTFTAEKILVATGGWPYVPEFPGSEHVITSNEVFDLADFPKRVIVVGGGYIAIEFAGIFNGLRAQTTMLYRGASILKHFDQDVREFINDEIQLRGVNLQLNADIQSVTRQSDQSLLATLTNGETLEADMILYATGRKPNFQGLGLENTQVSYENNGKIIVNKQFQTNEPSIFALGDITNGPELTPVALAEGTAFAKTQFDQQHVEVNYDDIPTAVFCQPNIGTVGLTEERARKSHPDISIYKSSFRPMKNTISGSEGKTLMKLIVDNQSDRVIGIHMVGEEAGEIIQGLAVAIKAGATKAQFDSTIGIHPTAAEEFVTMREPVS